jgi:ribosomal protein S18 acetylase RimI-like enzyme
MFIIERATVEEVDPIKQVLSETWAATYGDHLSRSTIEQVTKHWHDPGLLLSQIQRPGDFFAVAKDHDGRIIGLITLVALADGELLLSRLYVLPSCQGKGVGSGLLNAAIASYPRATVIRLEVERHNTRGHAYWRGQKFVDVGTKIEQIGSDTIEVITMERRLE